VNYCLVDNVDIVFPKDFVEKEDEFRRNFLLADKQFRAYLFKIS
jgi:hypothetical protein